jgi:hypothetical protein
MLVRIPTAQVGIAERQTQRRRQDATEGALRGHTEQAGRRMVRQQRGFVPVLPTKATAVASARKTARAHSNAQVVIRRKDGQIQSERTYDNDPRRRKG